MRKRPSNQRPDIRLTTAAIAAITLAGCAGNRSQSPITIDGSLAEWNPGVSAVHNQQTGAWCVKLDFDEERTLQATDQPTTIWIDADRSTRTGHPDTGAEHAITFSPQRNGQPGSGTTITHYAPDGTPTDGRHPDLALLFAPTCAAKTFEVTFNAPPNARIKLGDRPTRVTRIRPQPDAPMPPAAPPPPRPDLIRILSYNVEFASPHRDPEPFARMIRYLDPDILLLQEWQDRDGTISETQLLGWFQEHLPECSTWNVRTSAGWGVAVASKHPLLPFGPEQLERPDDADPDSHIPDFATRFVGAVVRTPIAPVSVASVHLKCCGSKDSPEDLARMAEADLINQVLAVENAHPDAPFVRVVAGDLNLVGSDPPLHMLRRSLDIDGSDLAIADAHVLNTPANYTWYQPTSRFTPGRLDYVLFSDATSEVAEAFALDTQRLTPEILAATGLQPTDSRASDHLPLVVDLNITAAMK